MRRSCPSVRAEGGPVAKSAAARLHNTTARAWPPAGRWTRPFDEQVAGMAGQRQGNTRSSEAPAASRPGKLKKAAVDQFHAVGLEAVRPAGDRVKVGQKSHGRYRRTHGQAQGVRARAANRASPTAPSISRANVIFRIETLVSSGNGRTDRVSSFNGWYNPLSIRAKRDTLPGSACPTRG